MSILACLTASACAVDGGTGPDAHLTESARLAVAAGEEIRAAVQGRRDRGFEDELLRIEAHVPGFGGLFVDTDGTPSMWLREPSREPEARTELAALALNPGIGGDLRATLTTRDVRVRTGRFTFAELVAASRVVGSNLRVPGVVALDADERLNRVRVRITRDASFNELQAAVASLGLPDSIVVFERSETAVALLSLRNRVRATGGALQISNSSSARCTLGYNVNLLSYPDTGFLTASHCNAGGLGGGGIGGLFYQSTVTTADTIGRTALNPGWNRVDSECQGNPLCTGADVLYADSRPRSSWSKRVAFVFGVGQNNSNGSIEFGPSPQWYTGLSIYYYPYVGMSIDKMGRTTGWTRGTVGSTCESPVVQSGSTTYVVLCATRVDNSAVGQGDSGSPVFVPPGGGFPLRAAGILFAGGLLNSYNSADQTYRCTSNCFYYFSTWTSIETHLSRVIQP